MGRRWRTPALVALVALLGSVFAVAPGTGVAGLAQERSEDEIARDLRDAEARRDAHAASLGGLADSVAAARAELGTIRADLRDARAGLRLAEGQLALAEAALDEAEAVRDQALRDLDIAVGLLARTDRRLTTERSDLLEQIAVTYKYGAAGRGAMYLEVIRHARTPNDVAVGLYQLGAVMDHQDGVVERVADLRDERASLRDEADRTRAIAEQRKADAEATFAVVAELREDARRWADQVAADEARQRTVLSDLEAEAGEEAADLAAASAEVDALEAELAEARRRAGGIVCPVRPSWFQDDWGYPRSGGRRHQGTDVFADRHTPIVAVADGTLKEVDRVDHYRPGTSSGDLGGRSVSYWVAPGEYWYFSHLEAVADGIAPGVRVTAGQTIGYVGNSGNARTTPTHTHVGRYVDGRAVNPYPSLAPAC